MSLIIQAGWSISCFVCLFAVMRLLMHACSMYICIYSSSCICMYIYRQHATRQQQQLTKCSEQILIHACSANDFVHVTQTPLILPMYVHLSARRLHARPTSIQRVLHAPAVLPIRHKCPATKTHCLNAASPCSLESLTLAKCFEHGRAPAGRIGAKSVLAGWGAQVTTRRHYSATR